MTTLAPEAPGRTAPASDAHFAVTVFASAALVFLVEPMVAKLEIGRAHV